ncbi:hypothetical protein OESDEN_15175 [Oesophagostomum dentatum]|uniref:Uncharacterized protein n=1 Tax=Oesophagostomum dentatum TaxID=61180 RepID=A0A0B1SJL9_OESDE|nr:hypothetical protein OESDEN_15175 [Oesophagostomum dentatum]
MIGRKLREELGSNYDEANIMVLARVMHRGLDGRSHPMTRVLLYDNKLGGEVVARPVDEEWLRLKAPREAAIWSICLYVSRSMNSEERSKVSAAFDAVVTRSGLRSPNSRTMFPAGKGPTPTATGSHWKALEAGLERQSVLVGMGPPRRRETQYVNEKTSVTMIPCSNLGNA